MGKTSLKIKKHHYEFVKKSIVVNTTQSKAWNKISNIAGLSEWVVNVKKTVYLSKKKRGIGAIRKISFEDGNNVEEHVVGWENGKFFSYIVLSGLPLHSYNATISIKPIRKKSVRITWQSYFISKKMTKKEFLEFVSFLETFYQSSLKNLKKRLES
jgi:hypothetical protein